MSFTLTNRSETSTILLLSPSKNRHISSSSVKLPSIKEIWAWTLTSDATASCSIRDVLQLKENAKDRMFCTSDVCWRKGIYTESLFVKITISSGWDGFLVAVLNWSVWL